MKQFTFYSLLIFALVGMLLVGSCSKNSPNKPDENLAPIDQDYGGFTTSNESPEAFLVDGYTDEEDPVVQDGVSDLPSVKTLFDSAGIRVYFVRITWGFLNWDSTETVTDWSGSAFINKGTLAVLRTIRFEYRLGDHIKHRTDRKNVEWVSYTGPSFDGIYFAIIDDDSTEMVGEFTFTTNLYSHTFTFDELDSLKLIETVDETGNQISIVSYNKNVFPFAGGFLEGRWLRDKERGGHFVGRWIHSTGMRAGYLKGIWGIDRFNRQVFYGKYINMNGLFGGLLGGIWGYDNEADGRGWFSGNWVNASFTKVGSIKGFWITGKVGDRRGFFRGRWETIK